MSSQGPAPSQHSTPDALAISLASVEPTWQQAVRVWWSWQWRIFIATILLSIGVHWWLAFMGGAIGLGARGYDVASQLLIYIGSALVSLYIFKDILDRDFGAFRVCIIPRENVTSQNP